MSPLIFPLPISFSFLLPLLLNTESLSASCWATSLWEADTMADSRLSTPRSHAFTEIPRSRGNKTPLCCSSNELGSVGVEPPIGFRAPHRCSLLSLFSAPMLPSGVAPVALPYASCFPFSYSTSVVICLACLLIPLPSAYPKLPVLVSGWSLLPGIQLAIKTYLPNKWINI